MEIIVFKLKKLKATLHVDQLLLSIFYIDYL